MALNQVNLKGVMYAFGTEADITAASGAYVAGRRYVVTADGFPTGAVAKFGVAKSATVILWDVTQAQITAIEGDITTLQNRATALEDDLAQEIVDRNNADASLQTAIDNEVAARQTAVADEVTARTSADTALGVRIDGVVTDLTTEVTARETAVSNEATARTSADTALGGRIDAEIQDRIDSDTLLTTRIGDEELARQVGDEDLQTQIDAMDVAYKAADATNLTTVNTSIANLAAALRDERVTDFSGIDYTASQSMTVASLLGSSPVDGKYLYKFNSTDINNTATVTGLPNSGADLTITYNDIVKVVVDGGVATSVSLVDDALKTKFDSVDSSISDLEAATTATAIRAHISHSGFVTFVNGVITSALSAQSGNDLILGSDGNPYISVQGTSIRYTVDGNLVDETVSNTITDIYSQLADVSANLVQASNGLEISGGDVVLGGALTKATEITGAYDLKLSNDTTIVNGVFKLPIWTVNADGSKNALGTTFVEMWFDGQGINYTFPN